MQKAFLIFMSGTISANVVQLWQERNKESIRKSVCAGKYTVGAGRLAETEVLCQRLCWKKNPHGICLRSREDEGDPIA